MMEMVEIQYSCMKESKTCFYIKKKDQEGMVVHTFNPSIREGIRDRNKKVTEKNHKVETGNQVQCESTCLACGRPWD